MCIGSDFLCRVYSHSILPPSCLLATSRAKEVVSGMDPLDVAAKAQDVMQQAESALGEKEDKQD